MKISGAVAVVTGASSGIGRATAVELAKRGATVAVMARRPEKLEATADACRSHQAESFAVVGDVARSEDCEAAARLVEERLGRADILVNNAGVSIHRDVTTTSVDEVEGLMRVNFLGAVQMVAQFLPGMIERRRGSIVNVGSVAGQVPTPKEAAYGASKAALHHWTHVLGIDLHGTGVHAGVLSPGPIDTEIWELDGPDTRYRGRKYPPEVVAAGAVRMIENELAHVTVPRQYGAVGPAYGLPLLGRAIRRGLVRYEASGSGEE